MAEQDGKYQDYTETFLPKGGHLRSDKEQADALDNEKWVLWTFNNHMLFRRGKQKKVQNLRNMVKYLSGSFVVQKRHKGLLN